MIQPAAHILRYSLLALAAALTACATGPTETERQDEREAEIQEQQQAAQQAEAERERLRQQRETFKLQMLEQADQALRDRRLTVPDHDNAYDRYATVLLLDPGNERAINGMQSIVLAYADLVRAALRRGQIQEARQLIERAEDYYPNNPLLRDLWSDVAQAEERARQQREQLQTEAPVGQASEIALPPGELSRRSEAVTDMLAQVGQRVQETNEQVLILARTDAEGRWIYKQINDAVPDYRVRGNIQLAPAPKLQLLPPI